MGDLFSRESQKKKARRYPSDIITPQQLEPYIYINDAKPYREQFTQTPAGGRGQRAIQEVLLTKNFGAPTMKSPPGTRIIQETPDPSILVLR